MGSEIEFECGHAEPAETDEFSPYADGYAVHEAGHVLVRYGEFETALKCMEFALDRGVVRADDDVVVIEETIGRAGCPRESVVVPAARVPTGGEGGQPLRPVVGRFRGSAALLAAAVVLGALLVAVQLTVVRGSRQETVANPQRLNSLVLQTVPEGEARHLPVVQDGAARQTEPETPAGTPPATAPERTEPLDETVTVLRGPNRKGGISTAFVPRERGTKKNESRMRWKEVRSSRLVTTLQSPEDAACTWQFRGGDGATPEYRTSQIAVEPGEAQKVEVPVNRWRTVTAVAETDRAGGDCFMVDPMFVEDTTKDDEPPRPVSTVPDRWLETAAPTATPEPAGTPTPSAEPSPTAPATSDGLLQSAGPEVPAKE
ncbi:hypothetical protein [Actinoplanes flavus]|uniref:Uncharacterized protein n=1 Tax=Actinoplanes flavus TaxID=2820290 RepID=A0ABS3URQ6_9ACTN|nr:hypothetical protein [Actinoplanes flavus]MBO3741166.1 hypothetical protein [Actinoplanes flavus]